MSRIPSQILRRAIALGVVGAVVGCTTDAKVLGPTRVNPLFENYVALGNSVTAGFQSGGLNDSTQRESYAFLLAKQMNTRFAYPSFPQPGCPAPTGNWVSQKTVDSLRPTPGGCTFRNPALSTSILNNVAVPFAYAVDLTTSGPALITANPLQTLILGGATQVDLALRADPTFVTVWIGNNEILSPATVGMLGGLPGSAPPLIPPTTFIPQYAAIVNKLVTAPNLKGGVLIGVIQVASAPRFFPADSLIIPANKAAFDTWTGRTSALIGCGASGYLMSTEGMKQIRSGALPAVVSCVKNTPQAPIGDIFMIDPTELATISGAVTAYNAYIKAKADSVGWAYVDLNPVLAQLRAARLVPTVPAFTSPRAPFGEYVSLDGVHPAQKAHIAIANVLIDAINAKYGTSVPKLPAP